MHKKVFAMAALAAIIPMSMANIYRKATRGKEMLGDAPKPIDPISHNWHIFKR
jgi:hypothetical protein